MQPFRIIFGLIVTGTLFWSPIATHAQSNYPSTAHRGDFQIVSVRNEISILEKSSRMISLKARMTRVYGFDPAVIQAVAVSPHRVEVKAVAFGVTTLLIEDEFGKTYSVEVFVEGDVRHLQSYIAKLFPDASVTAMKVKDSLLLKGVVADPSHIGQITEIAKQFYPTVINHMTFGAANQVRLEVRIMEAQRSKIRQLGFNWSLLGNNGYLSSNPGNLATPGGVTLSSGGGNTVTYGANGLSASSLSFGLVNANHIFRGFLEALKEEGLLRVLNETAIVADSGRPAMLHSGGQFPILVPQALGTVSVEWREFGVKLIAVPIVLGKGQVILEIAPEFSERDFANAASLNNTTIPAIITRKANTQVRMRMGQTLMIGGLIATRYTAETDKTPFLGELPYVGAAFRRVRYDETETELIILVTPQYVAPLNADQVPEGGPGMFSDIPTDRELFMQGLIEVPNYGGPTPPPLGGSLRQMSYPMESFPPGGISHPAAGHPSQQQFAPQFNPQINPQAQPPASLPYLENEIPQQFPQQGLMKPGSDKQVIIPLLPTPLPMEAEGTPAIPKMPAPPAKEEIQQNEASHQKTPSAADWYQSAGFKGNQNRNSIRPASSNRTNPSQNRQQNKLQIEGVVPPSLIVPTIPKTELSIAPQLGAPSVK